MTDGGVDAGRWARDLGALLALPAMWVDHEAPEIVSGLLSVLVGVLDLDGAYARFDEVEAWRPSGPEPSAELAVALEAGDSTGAGITTTEVDLDEHGRYRVARVPIALPWESGLVVVSAARDEFPTPTETHLLRVAVGQAAIANHTARRLARERAARVIAEETLERQTAVLRALAEETGPSLQAAVRSIRDASRLVAEGEALPREASPEPSAPTPRAAAAADGGHEASGRALTALPLSRREAEVLGLLAQGLSNKEIAAVMWLSDRTVERHITSLYRKIGVARRSEATAFALRHGVI
ncbi:LuxR family transcriptional regulator [Agromyces protaetiae]|uniref:LuxR family transcriptional regulator n=1 Tax=Agromyces protaetiae TaxID=2509455 RepID=A0A4P6F892_9MICO|nr:helix-turn-helix transcriptional regulator [Agromyces protaetiae]QAY72042.1 LuxR family transcriptional regulator [Agromyces protaetiae]